MPHISSPEHLVVDPASGRLSGILDWTDATLGDAARDFTPLVAFAGWPFVERVLASCPARLDPGSASAVSCRGCFR